MPVLRQHEQRKHTGRSTDDQGVEHPDAPDHRIGKQRTGEVAGGDAADGIVAYSSLCTHYGCPITTLHPSQTQIVCNCHGSVFNAADRGVVTNGPAQRRLAMLPLAIKDGAVIVTGKFDGPLGPPT